jgi:hypothetical protein
MDHHYLRQDQDSVTLSRTEQAHDDLQLVPDELVPQVKALMDAFIPFRFVNGQLEVAQVIRPNWNVWWDWEAMQWIDHRTSETQWAVVRARRNAMLAESDWTQMPDSSMATKTDLAAYRKTLRDITTQLDPFNINWPVAPGPHPSP